MTKRTSLYIDENLLKDLKILALHKECRVNELIIEYIEIGLSKGIKDYLTEIKQK